MKKIYFILGVIIWIWFAFSGGLKKGVKILGCYDGDTCRVQFDEGISLNVRLAGIDAPEMKNKRRKKPGQALGVQSRDYVNNLIKNKVVTIRQVALDRYNRPVVEIYLNDKLINLMIIKKGLAEVYKGKSNLIDKEIYWAEEKKAKKNKVGIWGLSYYVSPKEYRRKYH